MPIPWAKSHKQICLENFWQERVGMTLETAKTRMNTGFFARPYCSWYWIDTICVRPVFSREKSQKDKQNRPAERQIQQGGFFACLIYFTTAAEEIWPGIGEKYPPVWPLDGGEDGE